jgi:hypothetical protein
MKGRYIGTLLVAGAVGAASCFGDERQHIEQRQYQPEPNLTRDILLSTLSGTSPTLIMPFGGWQDQFI